MSSLSFSTAGGIEVRKTIVVAEYERSKAHLVELLSTHQGVLLSSNFEYPGRYTRWDIGFVDPPLKIQAIKKDVVISALNERGTVLLSSITPHLRELGTLQDISVEADVLRGRIIDADLSSHTEEDRTRRPSVFSVLREIIRIFSSMEDAYLGLYGAFGYDLAFQFEPIEYEIERDLRQRDLVLFLPDRLLVVDHVHKEGSYIEYDFIVSGVSTEGLPRVGEVDEYRPSKVSINTGDHQKGEYAACVERAKEAFKRGDLFEVVPGQKFIQSCERTPSELFRTLQERNPAPYGFLMNLGEEEYLVGASPEMYVRVSGKRVETCPISGTIARGRDAISDANQILQLLNSSKDASELTMCTDVDRNDKSRVCLPGSVRVIGRRQIEMYSRVIHTVDHVEGWLRDEFDALDAFLTHTWAVTVTGAPKLWAMRFIERHEKSPRCWYGGAVGLLGFDGNMNTGLTLRTVRIKNGVAEVRAGATLLYDSDPQAEEEETVIKASAFLDAIKESPRHSELNAKEGNNPGSGKTILLVDHEDSFVHTLGNYLRQTGATIITLRYDSAQRDLPTINADLVLLSPGPGKPRDFELSKTIDLCLQRRLPILGVCLGLQGIVEFFGGELGVLDYPMHGKQSKVRVLGGSLFLGLPEEIEVGRYHSLYAKRDRIPDGLVVTAVSEDDVVMAVEHTTLPIAAVQFHPESIMTLQDNAGLKIIRNMLELAK